ncbi:MAG: hypothetical protein HC911_10535 [Chloroflexaceae bacterium]|nr:hypothetical protein [Chloroflexaceae bacterium]
MAFVLSVLLRVSGGCVLCMLLWSGLGAVLVRGPGSARAAPVPDDPCVVVVQCPAGELVLTPGWVQFTSRSTSYELFGIPCKTYRVGYRFHPPGVPVAQATTLQRVEVSRAAYEQLHSFAPVVVQVERGNPQHSRLWAYQRPIWAQWLPCELG